MTVFLLALSTDPGIRARSSYFFILACVSRTKMLHRWPKLDGQRENVLEGSRGCESRELYFLHARMVGSYAQTRETLTDDLKIKFILNGTCFSTIQQSLISLPLGRVVSFQIFHSQKIFLVRISVILPAGSSCVDRRSIGSVCVCVSGHMIPQIHVKFL